MTNTNISAFTGQPLDPTQLDEAERSYVEPVPPGWYDLNIKGIDIQQTKSGTGYYVDVLHKVISGQYAGQTVRNFINVVNQSPDAERIGLQELGKLCRAAGIREKVTDLAVLLDKVVRAKVEVSGNYNDVKAYAPVRGGQTHAMEPPARAQQDGKFSWQQKGTNE